MDGPPLEFTGGSGGSGEVSGEFFGEAFSDHAGGGGIKKTPKSYKKQFFLLVECLFFSVFLSWFGFLVEAPATQGALKNQSKPFVFQGIGLDAFWYAAPK